MLLILAGVTITVVLGEGGIINTALKAKNETEKAAQNEQDQLNEFNNYIANGSWGPGENKPGGETPNPPGPQTPTLDDLAGKPADDSKNIEAEDEYGNKVVVPAGFRVLPHGTQSEEIEEVVYNTDPDHKPCVQDGIVIADSEDNQFVWIPVGDIKNKDGSTTTITLGRYTFNRSNGTPTLVQNADDYEQVINLRPSGYSYDFQELTSSSTNTPARNLSTFVSKTNSSGGYYLARYEASGGSGNTTTSKAKSKANKVVWIKITQPNAAVVARNMYSSSYFESDLVNSYMWDTAIMFIQNYSENSNYANKESVNSSLSNTGKTGDKVCNIHDMASNVTEWSAEHTTGNVGPCALRGGSCGYTGGFTAYRGDYDTTFSVSDTSFRFGLYLK
ncbi:MAG: hypothetical protein HFJ28_01225 [Clostridia bacterium]|nr:hypothetical protein [Clostridia bacterium]